MQRNIYFFGILVVLLTIISEGYARPRLSYQRPILMRTITFGEEETTCMDDKKREAGRAEREKVGSIRDKVYDLLQLGYPLTEDEKQEALDSYAFFVPSSWHATAHQVLSGNLKGLSNPSLKSISWLTGAEYDILQALRDAPDTVPEMRQSRSLGEKRAPAKHHLANNEDVGDFYGSHSTSPSSYEPLGLVFRTNTATRKNYINFNNDIQEDGGIIVLIQNSEADSFGFTVDAGFKGAYQFQVSTNQSATIITKVYSDTGCSALIASKEYSINPKKFKENDGAIVAVPFSGTAHCVTVSNKKDATIYLQMDNLKFGKPFAGAILFNEPPLNPLFSLSNSAPSAIYDYYGEGTIETGTYSVDRLGVYLTVGPQSNSYGDHVVIAKPSGAFSLKAEVPRGFYNKFGIFVASNDNEFSSIDFKLYSGIACSTPIGTQSYSFPEGAVVGQVYKAVVSVESTDPLTCVEIIYNSAVGDASISGLLFNTDLPIPTPTPTLEYIFNKAAFNSGALRAVGYNGAKSAAVLNDAPSSVLKATSVFQMNGPTIAGTGTGTAAGMCLDVAGGVKPGSSVLVFSCNGQSNQQWSYAEGTSWGAIKPASNAALCLATPDNSAIAAGTQLVLQKCDGKDNQMWSHTHTAPPAIPSAVNIVLTRDSPTSYASDIQNVLADVFSTSAKYVTFEEADNTVTFSFFANVGILSKGYIGIVETSVEDYVNTFNYGMDTLTITRAAAVIPSPYQYIFNKAIYDQRYFAVFDSNANFMSTLQQPTAEPTQGWIITTNTIKTQAGHCLDVFRNKLKEGAVVGTFKCNGQPNQKWTYGSTEQWSTITPESQPTLCLTPILGADAEVITFGASVKLQRCDESIEQLWRHSTDAPLI